MAGIIASSATQVMVSGDTAADKAVTGYLSKEQIALSTSPAGSTHVWNIAKPAGSTARSDISDSTAAAPTFTPDVAGFWTVTCTVDSTTTYVIRISVTQVAQVTSLEAIRLSPKADADVPAPVVGVALYYSTTQSALCIKDSAGDVFTVDVTAV